MKQLTMFFKKKTIKLVVHYILHARKPFGFMYYKIFSKNNFEGR